MAAHLPRRPPISPLIAIIGPTGTGKSKLAIELATRFNGEVVNSDAMQMYKGLPILTNKIPEHERNGVPHHLLDTLELDQAPWTVSDFVREAQNVVQDIRNRGRLPIVVGGTGYYVHSLLLRDATLEQNRRTVQDTTVPPEQDMPEAQEYEAGILSRPTPEIYARLQQVDPVIARRWHPNDRRKIQRSLEIYLRNGRKASEIYEEQNGTVGAPFDSAHACGAFEDLENQRVGFRYPSLILWLYAEDSALKARLDARVHDMVQNGLLTEVKYMNELELQAEAVGKSFDTSKGIWVSIGYKELSELLKRKDLQYPEVPGAEIAAIQAATRQYAKRQNRYIRLRLANALESTGELDGLFPIDTSDLAQWRSQVSRPSEELVGAFLAGKDLPEPSSLSEVARQILSAVRNGLTIDTTFHSTTCEVCQKVLMTQKEWSGHLNSNGHKKAVNGQRKRSANEARRRAADEAGTPE